MGDLHDQWLAAQEQEPAPPPITEEERADRAFVLALVSAHGPHLRHAHKQLRNDRDIVLAAVSHRGEAFRFASRRLQADRDVVLQAVAQGGGRALAHAAAAFRGDRDVLLAAVRCDGLALRFAAAAEDVEAVPAPQDGLLSGKLGRSALPPCSLDEDVELVLEAVAQTGEALGYASRHLRHGGLVAIVRRHLADRGACLAVFATARGKRGFFGVACVGAACEGGGNVAGQVNGVGSRAGAVAPPSEIDYGGSSPGLIGDAENNDPGGPASLVAEAEAVAAASPRAKLAEARALDAKISSVNPGLVVDAEAAVLPVKLRQREDIEPEAAPSAAAPAPASAVSALAALAASPLPLPVVRAAAENLGSAGSPSISCQLLALGRGGEEFLVELERSVCDYAGVRHRGEQWRVLRAAAENLGLLARAPPAYAESGSSCAPLNA